MHHALNAHLVLGWLMAHHHLNADQIRLAMVALVHQVQHLQLHRTSIWLTHIRGGRPGTIQVLLVKMGPGVLGARWG